MRVIGIDPGKQGAITWIGDTSTGKDIAVWDNPDDTMELSGLIEDLDPRIAYIEKAGTFGPGMTSSSSAFTSGVGYGTLLTVLALHSVSTVVIPAKKWQAHYSMTKRKDETKSHWKKRLCELARQREPGLKIKVSQADSVLIALYAYDMEAKKRA